MTQPLPPNLDQMQRVNALIDMIVSSLPEQTYVLETIAALGAVTHRCFTQIPDKTKRRNMIVDYIAIVASAGN